MASQLLVEIVNVSSETRPTKTGKTYRMFDVAYKNKSFQDKLEGKKVADFISPPVTQALEKAKFGDVFTVTREKDGEYWKWVNMEEGSQPSAQPIPNDNKPTNVTNMKPTSNVTPKSTYETAEERAARQILIVRQSSISSAVDFGAYNKLKSAEEIIAVAKQFEDYVFGKEVPVDDYANNKPAAESKQVGHTESKNFFEGMDDDIPE